MKSETVAQHKAFEKYHSLAEHHTKFIERIEKEMKSKTDFMESAEKVKENAVKKSV